MGNMVADAMRAKYPGVEAAYTNSGGLAPGHPDRAAHRGRGAGRDHLGRGLRGPAVRQPDGHRDPDRGPDEHGVPQRLRAVLRPELRWWHRAVPADLRAEGPVPLHRHDPGRRRHLEDAGRRERPRDAVGPADTIRFVTNDFMFTGGDGYTVFTQGTDVLSRATPCSTSPSSTSPRIRPSRRPSTAARSAPPGRSQRRPPPRGRPTGRTRVTSGSRRARLASTGDPRARSDPQGTPGPAGRLPHEGRPRRRRLRRQGAEPAEPGPQLLAEGRRRARRGPPDPRASSTGSSTSSTR